MTDLSHLDIKGLASLMIGIAAHGESQGFVDLDNDNESEKCLATLTLPKGFTDAAESFFSEKMCKTCSDQNCEIKDHLTNDFLNLIFAIGIKTIIDVGLKNANMQKM